MKVYDVVNRHHDGFWCAAPDEQAALSVAMQLGHIKRPENAVIIKDVTDSMLRHTRESGATGLQEILNGDTIGQMSLHGIGMSLQDVLSGKKAPVPH